MRNELRAGLTVALLLSGTAAALAQGAANNGIGTQGSLAGNSGTHASTTTGPAAAAQIPISPKPPTRSRDNPALENEPALGGGTQR